MCKICCGVGRQGEHMVLSMVTRSKVQFHHHLFLDDGLENVLDTRAVSVSGPRLYPSVLTRRDLRKR